MKIKKAIIPIAGKGTRFLPATKEIAKEIIPIINVPMIHYIVQEAVEAGIEQIIFVTSSGKFSVEDYFDRNLELEAYLERNNKTKELELIR
ncbi:MAG: UTP--glucose-1-phosphate uridylyltransferase, partial [Bdellovibrionales bacterium]|nr:UTP--glucose-1-phosphate uridylyltransferase [Bdellovibrionales bacterium]